MWPKDLSDGALVKIWIEALNGLSPRQIDAGFASLRQHFMPTHAAPFPSPGHLLHFINSAKNLGAAVEAEEEWQRWLPLVTRHYSPDTGWSGPKIPPRIDHALRAAGGVPIIARCPETDLVWRKKDFVECYLRDEQLPEALPLVPKALSDSIAEVSQRLALRSEPTLQQIEQRKELLRRQLKLLESTSTNAPAKSPR